MKSQQEAIGLETWFSIPSCPELALPPKWKMFLITTLAVYFLTLVIMLLEEHLLGAWPFPLLDLLTMQVMVGILIWMVIPGLSRYVFRKWLSRELRSGDILQHFCQIQRER